MPAVLPSREFTLTSAPLSIARRFSSLFASLSPAAWMVIDFAAGATAIVEAYSRTPWAGDVPSLATHLHPLAAAPVYGAAVVLAGHVFGMHDRSSARTASSLLVRAALVTLIAGVVLVLAASVIFYQDIGRHILVRSSFILFGILSVLRALVWHYTSRHPERVGVLGSREFLAASVPGMRVSERPVEIAEVNADSLPPHFLADWAVARRIDELVYHNATAPAQMESLLACLDRGIRVTSYTSYIERNHQCIPVNEMAPEWFLGQPIQSLHPGYQTIKRIGDVVLSLTGLLLSSPFMLAAILAVKLESRGPVFYSQIRTGAGNRPFAIWKLRSMRTDAEANGAQWASKGDSRVTRVGRILRKTRLDEIPQFWNILKGDMAFIGPRPERPQFVEQLAAAIPYYKQRHLVKPGLTGWAQINVDYGASVEDARNKLRYDLYYVKHASFEFDLHICIRTVGAIMKGAR